MNLIDRELYTDNGKGDNFRKILAIIVSNRSVLFWLGVFLVPFTFGMNEYYMSVIGLIAIYCMVTLGLGLMTGYTGQLSLGAAGFMGVGGYTSALLMMNLGCPPWLSIIMSGVSCGIIALIIGNAVMNFSGFILAFATLGFNVLVYIVIQQAPIFGGAQGIVGLPPLKLFGYTFKSFSSLYYVISALLCVMFIFSRNLVKSRIGRAFLSISYSESTAAAMGINVKRYKIGVFVVAGIFAGFGGAMLNFYLASISPRSFAYSGSLIFVLMVIFGGSKSLFGAFLGTFIITMWETLFREFAQYNMIGYAVLLLIVLAFFPKGIITGASLKRGSRLTTWLNRGVLKGDSFACPDPDDSRERTEMKGKNNA